MYEFVFPRIVRVSTVSPAVYRVDLLVRQPTEGLARHRAESWVYRRFRPVAVAVDRAERVNAFLWRVGLTLTTRGGEELSRFEIPWEFREAARTFSRLLERRGFETKVYEYPLESVVNFVDPELRRMLSRFGAPYDRGKAEHYAFFTTVGSLAFHTPYEERGRTILWTGEIPVPSLRKPIATGAWRDEVRIPEGVVISELHFHTEDTLPAVHLHLEGALTNLSELARFVGELRDLSKSALLESSGTP